MTKTLSFNRNVPAQFEIGMLTIREREFDLQKNIYDLSARSQFQIMFNIDETSQRSPSDSAVMKDRSKLARDGGTGSEQPA